MAEAQRPNLAAFYLPQFHPIPENDKFWGTGFTEWRNVTTATPRFPGHRQPKIPTDLGFYDLRLVETQIEQARLARRYGINAFCYYHYWFNGRIVLGNPLKQMLAEPAIDLPFFVCWANENWTRRWDGMDDEVLLFQEYSPDDDRAHIQMLLPVLADDRYHRVNGRPILLVYRARLLPSPVTTAEIWRSEAQKAGIGDLHLCAVESLPGERGDPGDIGFDAAVEFQPDWSSLGPPRRMDLLSRLVAPLRRTPRDTTTAIHDYSDVARKMMAKPAVPYRRYPCVTPHWDNTARRQRGAVVLADASPNEYEHWLRTAIRAASDQGDELVFVNAWNEWAEGAYLEPDLHDGHSYLEATLRATQTH